MKKLAVLVVALVLAVLSQAPAQAEEKYGFYITPKVFWSYLEADVTETGKYNDNVGGGALAIGYDFNNRYDLPLRLEIEGAFRADGKHDDKYTLYGVGVSEKYEVGVTSIFANVYYDFHNSSDFTPYVGGGLGTARIKAEATAKAAGYSDRLSKSSWDFAWNVGAGVAYNFTETVALDLGYRYADFGTLAVNGVDLVDITGHEILLGVRFTF